MNFGFTLRYLSVLTAGLVASVAFAANQTGNLPQELWPGPASTGASTASAAEVRADLQLWQQAGMERYSQGDGVGFDSADYERRLQHYYELRQSPAYQELVDQFQARK